MLMDVDRNSKVSLRDSKIQTIETVGEKFGNEVVNDYQGCLGTSSPEQLLQSCTIGLSDLVEFGYLENNDIVDPETNDTLIGNVLLCYDPAHVSIYASYVSDDNYSCKDIAINSDNTLALSSVGGVGYVGGNDVEVSVIKSGDFEKFTCQSSNEDLASCSINNNRLSMKITNNKDYDFGEDLYKTVEISVYGEYFDDDQNSKSLTKTYSLKVYPTDLSVDDEGKTCVAMGTSTQAILKVLNAGTLSVTSSDQNVLEGIARDGILYMSTKVNTGLATLTVKEANGNNIVNITKNVYNLKIGDVFPQDMVINHYVDVPIEYSGTGTIKISSDNPSVLKFSASGIAAASEITLTNQTSFRIIASGMGIAKVTIEGENCGQEVRDMAVSGLTFKDESQGLVYIGGGKKSVEIEVEEATNLQCTSSNPSAATCEIHATTVDIIPGTVAANNVTLTVGSPQAGYAYYRLQVLKTAINVVNNSGRTVSTVCREKGSTYNSDQIFVTGTNLGETVINEIEDWYLAEATVANGGAQRNVNVFPRNILEIYSPYVLGENTGRTKIEIKENNGNQIASFNYNIYSMKASRSSATLEVGSTFDFDVEVSGTGEISLTTSNSRVATASIVQAGTYSWTPNAVNSRKIRIKAVGTGAATISVRGADCGVTTFNVIVDGKNFSINLVPGTYTTSLGSEVLSCETEGEEETCEVKFPQIYTSSEFQVIGYSRTKDSTTATYKVNERLTLSTSNSGQTFYGNSVDRNKPVCSLEENIPNISIGGTSYVTLNCIDTGSGITGTGALSASNFTVSNTSIGELVEVGSPIKTTNGYSYRLGVRNKQVGLWNLSIKAGAVKDVFNNGNDATNLGSFFGSQYNIENYYFIGKTNRNDVIAVLYDNSVLGSGSSETYSLYIYGTGEILDFMSSSYASYAPWYNDYRTSITNVVVNSGVTNIGSKLAYNSTRLTSVTIPSGVISIGDGAFANAALTEVVIPNTVTTIGNESFYGNKDLSSLTLGSGITSIGTRAFYNHHISNLTIPSSVVTIGESAFGVEAERSVLSTLQIPSNSQLTTIGNSAFIYHKLTSLNIPSSVRMIGNRAFEQVDVVSGTLTTLTFANNASLTSIGDDSFAYNALTSLSLPASLESIGARAFAALRAGVKTIAIGRNVRAIGNNFAYGEELATITVDYSNSYFTSDNGVLYNKNMTTLVKCPDDYYITNETLNVPSTVTTLQAGAFDGWLNFGSSLRGLTVNLPSKLANMNIDNNFIFYAISAININGNNQFESVSGVLFNKNKTTAYRLPLAYTSSSYTIPSTVTTVADYFSYGNTRVSAVTIPSSVNRIGMLAFAADTNYGLETINLYSTDSLVYSESSFTVMVYPNNGSLASRSRTMNVANVNLKSRLENLYSGVSYVLRINKVDG